MKKTNRTTSRADKKNRELVGIVGLYRCGGLTYKAIAEKLNLEGRTNSLGRPLNSSTVYRLHKKYQQEQQQLLKK